ncbi:MULTISPECIES: YwqH-like family protein [Priestia]|uniref:YwqH-like family protein n=1 Tax=Priestia TaxID=2800373 RepID=UPI0005EBF6D4|nr:MULTISPECIES: DUF5082 family protein [Priestia]KJL05268.1 hypothetical protein N178_08715 [Priestia aryabhattai B8W22]MBX4162557.1 DUF5082 domain-containing protein [Priestia megaterium]MCM3541682.1 DUF5082 domain-containing protein [Priestia megaterium]
MGLGSVLDGLLGEVSGRVSDVEGKISKLRTAKSKIEHEQAVSLKEIEHIKKPELGDKWTGTLSDDFDEKRTAAYDNIKGILDGDYDGYIREIETKIWALEAEKGALSGLNAVIGEADSLLAKGEEAYDAVENKISEIRKGLFS